MTENFLIVRGELLPSNLKVLHRQKKRLIPQQEHSSPLLLVNLM